MNGDNESEEPASIQQDEEAAFEEFAQQLADERAELERIRSELARAYEHMAELESGGTGSAGLGPDYIDGSPVEPVAEAAILPENDGSDLIGAGPEPPAVVVEEAVVERPPRSNHPIYRKLWGRDLDGPEPGEHWIYSKPGA